MRQGRAVLDHQDPAAPHQTRILEPHRRGRSHHRRLRQQAADVSLHPLDLGRRRGVSLGDDHDVRHPQHRLARVVGELVPGTERIRENDVQIWPHERKVVVPAVPEDDIRLAFGRQQDALVVDAGKHHVSDLDVRLVFLSLLDGTARGIQCRRRVEALNRLARQVAVGHGMAEHRGLQSPLAQATRHPAASLRLAATGAHGGNGDHRLVRFDHRSPGSGKAEIRPGRQHP